MATIKFIVRDTLAETAQTIYITARFGRNEKLMYASPQKIKPLFWDAIRQRAKVSRYYPIASEINIALDKLAEKISQYILQVVSEGGDITKDQLTSFLDIHFGKKKSRDLSFHSFFDEYIDTIKKRMNAHRGGQLITDKTRWEYGRTLFFIKQYEEEEHKILGFEDITQDFLTDFVGFLQQRNLATNTISHKVICIKAVMRAALERGLTNNMRWQYYKNVSEKTENIALNESELQLLKDADLSAVPRLERVRDLFLLGCWTGLRFSDVTKIKSENIKEGIITIVQSKTNAVVAIPVHPVFEEIWNKYNGQLPLHISNQKFNKYIKEVCRKVGLNEPIIKSITKGGKRITTTYEKWQLVSSHTARRSFATNLYRSGFPAISIMQITGHKTEAAFLRYIKVDKEEHARMLAEHWRNQLKPK